MGKCLVGSSRVPTTQATISSWATGPGCRTPVWQVQGSWVNVAFAQDTTPQQGPHLKSLWGKDLGQGTRHMVC